MKNINGTILTELPLKLEEVQNLIYYDGPLCIEYKDELGNSYLYHWCDHDYENSSERWMVLRVKKEAIESFINGSSFQGLIESCLDDFVYLIDQNWKSKTEVVKQVSLKDIPIDYMPIDGEIKNNNERKKVI